MLSTLKLQSRLPFFSKCWTHLRQLSGCANTAAWDGWRDWKRSGDTLINYDNIDRSYYLNPANQEAVVSNIKVRKLKNLLKDLEKCTNDVEISSFLESNVTRLPNKLDERWNNYSPFSAIEELIVEESDSTILHTLPKHKKYLYLAEQLSTIQTSRHDNIGAVGSSRSYALLAELAQLHQALIDWTLDELIYRYGFTPVIVPHLVYEDAISGCGYSSRGRATQIYKLYGTDQTKPFSKEIESSFDGDICLAGTSEVPLTGLHIGETFDESQLPKKYCTVSRCYRAEISNVASETGLYRVPYFTKVEMYALTRPENSNQVLSEMLDIQKYLLSQLDFKFRLMDMPPEELGLNASRKFDLEVLFPGSKKWGEVCSASNCTDFQSRRFNIKYKSVEPNYQTNEPFKIDFVHTINATACALPRILIGLLEYWQQEDGSILIPSVLINYMNGQEKISKNRQLFIR